jgi:sugar diacid utilization regulator
MSADGSADATDTDPGSLSASYRSLECQNELLSQLVTIYERMTTMVLQGSDLESITTRLAELVERSVTVFDPTLQALAEHDPNPQERQSQSGEMLRASELLRQALSALPDGRRPIRLPLATGDRLGEGSCVLAPIVGGSDEILGYVMLLSRGDERGTEQIDLLAAQHAATMYALVLMRQRIAADVGNKLRSDLVEGLLSGQLGDAREAEERATYLGLRAGTSYRVLVMMTADDDVPSSGAGARQDPSRTLSLRRHVLEMLTDLIMSRFPETIAAARQQDLIVIAPDRESDDAATVRPHDIGKAAIAHAESHFPSVKLLVGLGTRCRVATEITASYNQARRALDAAIRFDRIGQVTSIEDLGILRLLYQVADADELNAFAYATLGRLIDYDRDHKADLLRTLAVYLRNSSSMQHAARELFLHPNTVSYRLQRIAKISGLDLGTYETRLSVEISLKILDIAGYQLD